MTTHTSSDPLTGFIALIIAFLIYFLPYIVAANRRHVNKLAIGMLNFFLGWTLVGWVIAIVWACTSNIKTRS